METLEHAYDAAIAVLTAPVSFVEWTTLKVESFATPDPTISDDWSPVGVSMHYGSQEYEWEPTRAIEGERYIYVFSRRAWAKGTPTFVEELHLRADGQIEVAKLDARRYDRALDGKDSPIPEKPQWIKVGTTMRFARRLRGSRMLHWFFASRIPLSRRFVEELRLSVALWVPATTFDDYAFQPPSTSEPNVTPPSTFGQWDPNVVTDQGPGALQVPVLDPLTIALHLHLLASSAADDLYDYLTVDERRSAVALEHVEKRQQKLVLGYVVQLVLKNYNTSYGHEMHDVAERTDKFVRQYWEQVNHRIQENERWWFYLSNWLKSEPIQFLARTHHEHPDKHWLSFLLPILLCLVGANSSVPGRELLKELIEDRKRFKWFRREVLPGYHDEYDEDEKAAKYQIPRKFALAVLETLKELAPLFVELGGTEEMFRVLAAYGKFNIWIMVDGTMQITDPHKAAEAYAQSAKKLGFKVTNADELVEEWKEITYHPHKTKMLKLAAIVELLDLALSLRQFLKERSNVNSLTLGRSMADTSALVLEFAHGTKGKLLGALFKARGGIVVVAGVLEIVVGTIEAEHAAHKHDYVGKTSAEITITGAAISTAGYLGAVALGISATPFVVAGLIVMGVGAIVGLFKDTPMDTFLKFCAFGDDGGGGEIVPGLEEMKEGEYGQQLEVLINLICAFQVERADKVRIDGDPRVARFTMGWFTEKSYMDVDYEDEWFVGTRVGGIPALNKRVSFGPTGVRLTTEHTFDLYLSTAPEFEPFKDAHVGFKAHFSAQLHVVFDEFKIVVPPKKRELWIELR